MIIQPHRSLQAHLLFMPRLVPSSAHYAGQRTKLSAYRAVNGTAKNAVTHGTVRLDKGAVMASFQIESIQDDENPFDRQERIKWWSQEKIQKAKVMVIGAGAIGNETLKNLALLGVRNVFIVDMDIISTSNLSRTVLFSKEDLGQKKAEVAADRFKAMSLSDNVRVDWFNGDVVWELGTGVYRYMDLVLGCLDNVETRIAVNRQCWLAGTPWIDSGISELAMNVTVYKPPVTPCYECSLSREQREAARRRYSCDNFKRKLVEEEKVPTVQVASAIAAAIQTQEAMKILCDQTVMPGKKIYYQGKNNDFDILQLPDNPSCLSHSSYSSVIPLSIDSHILLGEFLETVSKPEFSGTGAVLDFSSFRDFIVSAPCKSCGKDIPFYKSSFEIYDTDLICEECASLGNNFHDLQDSKKVEKVTIAEFGSEITESKVLGMTLHQMGVPFWAVLPVRASTGEYKYYELLGDKRKLLPSFIDK